MSLPLPAHQLVVVVEERDMAAVETQTAVDNRMAAVGNHMAVADCHTMDTDSWTAVTVHAMLIVGQRARLRDAEAVEHIADTDRTDCVVAVSHVPFFHRLTTNRLEHLMTYRRVEMVNLDGLVEEFHEETRIEEATRRCF